MTTDRRRAVVIDCFLDSLDAYRGYAVVAIDVIRATTTAVTAAALGRRCFPVGSIEEAVPLAGTLSDPLLAGELGGNMPYGFHVNNSPAALSLRTDIHRPMILLSTSGTRLICSAGEGQAMYVACLRNYRAVVEHLAVRHTRIAIIGAGTRGEFREEDQLCAGWMARGLFEAGYEPEDEDTAALAERWEHASVDSITKGKSAQYLRDTGQIHDLEFILSHVDDLDEAYIWERGGFVRPVPDPMRDEMTPYSGRSHYSVAG